MKKFKDISIHDLSVEDSLVLAGRNAIAHLMYEPAIPLTFRIIEERVLDAANDLIGRGALQSCSAKCCLADENSGIVSLTIDYSLDGEAREIVLTSTSIQEINLKR